MADGRVLVVGSPAETGILDHLTEELVRRRFDVRAAAVPLGSSHAEVAGALSAEMGDEWVRAIVFAPIDADLLHPAPLGDDDGWDERCEHLLTLGLHVTQAAHQLMGSDGGGQVIFVLPDIGLVGAPGQVPLATAVEGLRALAKSAARQWGHLGLGTASIVVPGHLIDPDAEAPPRAPSLPEPDVEAVADVIVALLGPAGAALNGVTLPVDGGVLMVP